MAGYVCRNYKTLLKFCQINAVISKRFYCDNLLNQTVIVTKQKHLYLIGINRAEERNIINRDVLQQLICAFNKFEKDDEAYVAVLYGKGGNFCSGYDLQDFPDETTHNKEIMGLTSKVLKKPVVAAVNGYTVAGGFELALWCDLRVVEETAVMGFFNRRFGIPSNNGSSVRLPQIVGLSRALDLLLTGRSVSAKESFEMGLATKVTACGTGIGNAINLANSLCKFPQECLRADRLSAYHAVYDAKTLEEALKFEWENSLIALKTESVEGAKKFMQGIGRHGTFHLDSQEKDVSKNL